MLQLKQILNNPKTTVTGVVLMIIGCILLYKCQYTEGIAVLTMGSQGLMSSDSK